MRCLFVFMVVLTSLGVCATTDDVLSDSTVALHEVEVESSMSGNYLSGSAVEKREMINSIGLKKMACCTLAESFENSASVSVGYSDAVTGARQIRMLGLAGVYTQFLDESRPTMRGLVSPYALNYTPGDWLRSIQVSKGVTSVTTGHEAITGQINLEYRKPTDDERLHVNFYLDDMLRPELNLTSAIHFKQDKSLSTIIMVHGSIDTDWREMGAMDRNHDNFRDLPNTRQVDVANRWLWLLPNGMQLRWGARYTAEDRLGGQLNYHRQSGDAERQLFFERFDAESGYAKPLSVYGSHVTNHDASAYLKVAMPLRHIVTDGQGGEWQDNVALVADWSHFDTRSYFGYNGYNAHENSVSLNLRMDHYLAPHSSLAVGVQGRMNYVRGAMLNFRYRPVMLSAMPNHYSWLQTLLDEHLDEREIGAYAEWNATLRQWLTLVAGMRVDYNDWAKQWLVTPRLHVKWDITPRTTLRASGGMGYRTPRAIIENLGMLATGRDIVHGTMYLIGHSLFPLDVTDLKAPGKRNYNNLEKALTVGGSLTQTFTLGRDQRASLSLDYFHTHFFRSLLVTQEPLAGYVLFYNSDATNYTNTWQVDFNWTPVERLDVLATFRYSQSRVGLPMLAQGEPEQGVYYLLTNETQTVERALTSRFKGVLNLSYATRFRIWVFDITGQLNGPMRVPVAGGNIQESYHSPTYGQLFAQVTRKIGHAEVYVGCENITDYRQKDPILGADDPFGPQFNSMNVWGPLMGRKFYVGVRWNLY